MEKKTLEFEKISREFEKRAREFEKKSQESERITQERDRLQKEVSKLHEELFAEKSKMTEAEKSRLGLDSRLREFERNAGDLERYLIINY